MQLWEAALLGLIQGLTEFLPISSSGHLVLAQYILGVEGEANVTFEVFVHFGTALSIMTVYRRRLATILIESMSAIREARCDNGVVQRKRAFPNSRQRRDYVDPNGYRLPVTEGLPRGAVWRPVVCVCHADRDGRSASPHTPSQSAKR